MKRAPHLIVFTERWFIGWIAFLCTLMLVVFAAGSGWAWSTPLRGFKQGLIRVGAPLMATGALVGLLHTLWAFFKPKPTLVIRDKGVEIAGVGLVAYSVIHEVRLEERDGLRVLVIDARAPWLAGADLALHAASLRPGVRVIAENLARRGVRVRGLKRRPAREAVEPTKQAATARERA